MVMASDLKKETFVPFKNENLPYYLNLNGYYAGECLGEIWKLKRKGGLSIKERQRMVLLKKKFQVFQNRLKNHKVKAIYCPWFDSHGKTDHFHCRFAHKYGEF